MSNIGQLSPLFVVLTFLLLSAWTQLLSALGKFPLGSDLTSVVYSRHMLMVPAPEAAVISLSSMETARNRYSFMRRKSSTHGG